MVAMPVWRASPACLIHYGFDFLDDAHAHTCTHTHPRAPPHYDFALAAFARFCCISYRLLPNAPYAVTLYLRLRTRFSLRWRYCDTALPRLTPPHYLHTERPAAFCSPRGARLARCDAPPPYHHSAGHTTAPDYAIPVERPCHSVRGAHLAHCGTPSPLYYLRT